MQIERAQRPPVLERLPAHDQDVALALKISGTGLLQVLLDPFQPAFGHAEIRQNQLVLHRPRIACRFHLTGRVGHCRIAEGAHDVHQCVGILVCDDVDERLGAAARRREVGEFNGGRHALARVVHRGQAIEPRVGNFRNADRGFTLAVRGARGPGRAGHELEEGGLAAGRESNEGGAKHAES